MNFPITNRLELPILQELSATGGSEDVRFIYERLVSYFPQLDANTALTKNFAKWRTYVQRAGKELDEQGLIKRNRGIWSLTKSGKSKVEAENVGFELNKTEGIKQENSHKEIQKLLVEIGQILGFYAETEFEFYDVVWREKPSSTRLSHVFEVQSKGNIDSAFAKLKRAYNAQRSKIFLILNSERDANRANQSLSREFHELEGILQIYTFAQVNLLHQSLNKISNILPTLLEK